MACHAQTLNLFVESFLKMVQKLLEDTNPHLQILATNSVSSPLHSLSPTNSPNTSLPFQFVRFANIEEDTPSYHRRYDFFISKFSSMCHGSHENIELRDSIRMGGIRGLQGVIRKTVSDDLVENIWDKQHMEKIIPSLLFNMQTGPMTTNDEEALPSTPPVLAETVLRELVSRASFAHIRSVLKPLLTHVDRHELWVPNDFAIHTFRIVMISIQPQYSYTVVETLMQHLDTNSSSSPKTRTSLAVVLSKIIAIAAGENVGPSTLDITNNLLTHLRTSVSKLLEPSAEEIQYQEALINALGEFANHHPDYQKIEIMLFIMNIVPDLSKKNKSDQLLQNILLKSLLKVGTQYRTVSYEKAFQASFLQPLLRMARAPHVPTRIIVMQILQALLDRHQNQAVLHVITVKHYPALSVESPSRQDIIFIHKHGVCIMQSLIDAMSLDDRVDALTACYNTAALIIAEMACPDTVQEMLLFVLGMQQTALDSDSLSPSHKSNLHSMVIALLALLARCTGINNLLEYCNRIVELRRSDGGHLLPPLDDAAYQIEELSQALPQLMLDKGELTECLKQAGLEFNHLSKGTPYVVNTQLDYAHRPSWMDMSGAGGIGNSNGDLSTFTNDTDSVSSSPGVQRKPILPQGYNFDAMKRRLAKPTEAAKRQEQEKQLELSKVYRESNFEDLLRRTEPKVRE